MIIGLLAARLVLGAILLVAGVAKFLDLGAFRRGLADFGLPAGVVRPVGVLLPAAEIAIAVALWSPAAAWGAAGALALFTAFSAVIAGNLWHGRRPPCGCFGQFEATPISRATLVRTLLLAVVAGVLTWRGPGAPLSSVFHAAAAAGGSSMLAIGLGAVLFMLQGAFIFMLLRQQGRLLIRLEALEARLRSPSAPAPEARVAGLPIGTAAPDFHVTSLDGEPVSWTGLSDGTRAVVLVFTDPDCPACESLSSEIDDWRHDLAHRATIVVISARGASQGAGLAAAYGTEDVYTQSAREVSDLFEVVGTPSAVLIRDNRTIGSRLAEGADAIRQLMTSVTTLAVGGNARRQSQPVLQ